MTIHGNYFDDAAPDLNIVRFCCPQNTVQAEVLTANTTLLTAGNYYTGAANGAGQQVVMAWNATLGVKDQSGRG